MIGVHSPIPAPGTVSGFTRSWITRQSPPLGQCPASHRAGTLANPRPWDSVRLHMEPEHSPIHAPALGQCPASHRAGSLANPRPWDSVRLHTEPELSPIHALGTVSGFTRSWITSLGREMQILRSHDNQQLLSTVARN